MPFEKTEKIWMDGELVPWDEARVHVLTHSLHYGSGVFEGIRTYAAADGPAVFRLTDHIQRLFDSAKLIMMTIPYTREEQLLRHDLYLADEAFLTGTAAEVVPIRSVDDREIGNRGQITRKLQETYFAAVRGNVEQYKDWLEYVR